MQKYLRHSIAATAVTAALMGLTTVAAGPASAAPNVSCGTVTDADRALVAPLRAVLAGKMHQPPSNLDAYEVSCARAVVNAVRARGLPDRASVIAITTVIVESELKNNPNMVDLDSVGLFQQRASWGSTANRLDPTTATNKFIDAMLGTFPNNSWLSQPIGVVCQAVQISNFPAAYAPQAADAQKIVDALVVPDFGPAVPTASRASVYNPVTQTSEIFAVGADGSMLHDSNTAGAGWSGWTTLGAGARFKGAPVAAFNPSTNAMELFALGTDDSVWHAYYFQGGWSDWSVMGASSKFVETPAAVFNPATNAFELFGRGTDNSVWHAYNQNGTGWSEWTVMNGEAKFKGAPTAAYNPDTQALELFALGTDNALYHAYFQNGTGWSEWSAMNVTAKFRGTPSVAYNPGTHALELFGLGTDNAVWHNYIQNGTAWEGWSVMDAGSKFKATPTAVFNPSTNAMELFGLGTDNAVWHNAFQESTGWSGWVVMVLDFKFKTAPAAVFDAATNSLELFDLGTDNSIWHATYHAGWSSWSQLGAGPYAIL